MPRITADELKRRLDLRPLPGEGGYYHETYRCPGGERAVSTAIYYLLTPDTFSAMHRLPTDEVYHFYLGDPVEMLQLGPDGGQVVMIGNDLLAGQVPQLVVPAGVWQGSRLVPGGEFALMGTTMAPGFEFRDYQAGERERLIAECPEHAKMIRSLTR